MNGRLISYSKLRENVKICWLRYIGFEMWVEQNLLLKTTIKNQSGRALWLNTIKPQTIDDNENENGWKISDGIFFKKRQKDCRTRNNKMGWKFKLKNPNINFIFVQNSISISIKEISFNLLVFLCKKTDRSKLYNL